MRRTLLGGLLLVAAAFFTVLVGGWLDLELDAVAVLGVAAGAVVALVPDATAGRRLAGFALGVVAAVLGYYVRAALTPDTSMGRAVFAALVVALCVVVAAASVGRLPLWSALLGAGTFAGSFESTYSSAVPRVVDLSIGALTTLAAVRRRRLRRRRPRRLQPPRAPLGAPRRRDRPRRPPHHRRADGARQVRTSVKNSAYTVGAGLAALALASTATAPGAYAASEGDVDVVNTETVQVYVNPDGSIESQKVYEQLTLTGTGTADIANPIEEQGLRNLNGFESPEVEDGVQNYEVDVDGVERLRSVSEYTGELPLDISVEYRLDGELVEPGDVVGSDGELEVLYTARNITAEPQEVTFAGRPGRHRHRDRRRPDPDGRLADHHRPVHLHRGDAPSRPTWPATARAAPSSASR